MNVIASILLILHSFFYAINDPRTIRNSNSMQQINSSKYLQNLFSEKGGALSQKYLGMHKDELKRLIPPGFKMESEMSDMLVYSVEMKHGEFLSIIYYLDKDEVVNSYGAAIIVNPSHEKKILGTLVNYMNTRHHSGFTDNQGGIYWIEGNYRIALTETNLGSKQEIEIEYYKD